jgi:hypothetical protein
MRAAWLALVSLALGCGSDGLGHASSPFAVTPLGDASAPSQHMPSVAESTGVAPAAAAPDGPPATAEENARIAATLEKVTRVRGLAALHPVPGVVLSRDALIARVKAHVDREVPPEAIRHEGLELQLFGFVPVGVDYEAETFKLLQAQLAGFYEETDGTMYMAGDLDEMTADATLSHELVHALQDQHFDLKPHSKYQPGMSDVQAAFSALAEGDATSAMADSMLAKMSPGATALDLPEEMFMAQVTESVSTGPAAAAPHVMRSSLVAPYIYGTVFVNALRRTGGWRAVDAAWKDLPTTTEQILHLAKWRAHEPALAVKAPTFATLGAGWASVDEDTNGELGLRIAFQEWMGDESANKAAEGWGGDRESLVANGDQEAAALRIRYDAARSTQSDPFALLADGLVASVGKPAVRDASWVCIERPALGPLGAMKLGKEIAIVAGPAKTGATWSSTGTCALAKKWATEVLSGP